MAIIGHGIDITSVDRIREMIADHGPHFLGRVFSDAERSSGDQYSSPSRRVEHFAGRFAVKEAALKALGTGWRDGIAWTDVETLTEPSGAPVLRLHRKVSELASQRGVRTTHVSISHSAGMVIASVILES